MILIIKIDTKPKSINLCDTNVKLIHIQTMNPPSQSLSQLFFIYIIYLNIYQLYFRNEII